MACVYCAVRDESVCTLEQTYGFVCCHCQTAYSMQFKLSIKQHDTSG